MSDTCLIDVSIVAPRLGVSVSDLLEAARMWQLETTYSVQEVAAHLGCSAWQIHQLVALGRKHGKQLHHARGGLYPTFKTSHKARRIPLSAIVRHKQHMESAAA